MRSGQPRLPPATGSLGSRDRYGRSGRPTLRETPSATRAGTRCLPRGISLRRARYRFGFVRRRREGARSRDRWTTSWRLPVRRCPEICGGDPSGARQPEHREAGALGDTDALRRRTQQSLLLVDVRTTLEQRAGQPDRHNGNGRLIDADRVGRSRATASPTSTARACSPRIRCRRTSSRSARAWASSLRARNASKGDAAPSALAKRGEVERLVSQVHCAAQCSRLPIERRDLQIDRDGLRDDAEADRVVCIEADPSSSNRADAIDRLTRPQRSIS